MKTSSSESDLAEELKSHCEPCGDQWKENCLQESAKIFHQLGLFYRDKCLAKKEEGKRNTLIAFIQSAALLNCALDRQPLSKTVEEDLRILCAGLLKNSNAQQQDFDLVEFACNLKQEIDQWRNDLKERIYNSLPIADKVAENDLEKFEREKIRTVESLQDEITNTYKYFMTKVSEKCIEVLGHNPCDFSLVGLGSMARKEITPFSDFESIIVLKDKGCCYSKELDYFRWYAVLFQIIVINLRETPLHSVAIPSLNGSNTDLGNWFLDTFTKRGISFDSMMPYASKNPLGKQPTKNKPFTNELIKPVSEMVEYLTQEQDVKNGYQLSDILTCTCLITGSEDVYSDFEAKREAVLRSAKVYNAKEVKDMIKKDMQIHSTKLGISSTIENNSYNVKKLAYRSTTIFITGIAKWHNIKPGSCFELVQNMEQRGLIFGNDFCRKLQYAVALACEIRLKTYLEHNCQWDYAELSEEDCGEDLLECLINAVGLRSCYDYFEIACCLQYDAIELFQLDRSYLFHSCVTMFIAISALLRLKSLNAAKEYIEKIRKIYAIKKRPFLPHQPTAVHSNNTNNLFWNENDLVEGADFVPSSISTVSKQTNGQVNFGKDSNIYLGHWYKEMQQFSSKCFPNQTDRLHSTNELLENPTGILLRIAHLLFETGVYFEAEYCFITALKTTQSTTNFSKNHKAKCFYWIGMCLLRTRKYNPAIEKFDKAQSFGKNPKGMEHFEGYCKLQVGLCLRHLGKAEEAIKIFESALKIFPCNDEKISEDIAFCMLNKGFCWWNMHKNEDALKQFEKLLQFCRQCSNVSQAFKANCLYYSGYYLQNLNRQKEARKRLDEAIQIYNNDLQHNERNDADRAKTHIHIGNCFKVMNDNKRALNCYLESLKLWKKLHQKYPGDHLGYWRYSKAMAYKRIGSCYQMYNSCEKAIENCVESLKIFEDLSRCRKNLTSNLYDLQRSLGGAFRGVGDFNSACECYRKCLAMVNETTPKKQEADLHRQIGDCLQQMKQPYEESSEKALEIYKELIKNEEKDKKSLLKCIGLCYKNLGKNELARDSFYEFIVISKKSNSSLLLTDRIHIASVFKYIGKLWNSDGCNDDAKRAFEESLDIFSRLPKSLEYEHEIAYLNNQIGEHWLSSASSASPHSVKEFKNIAKSKFKNAESCQKMLRLTSKGKRELARTYKNLGKVFCKQWPPQYREATINYENAKKLYEEMGIENFPQDNAYLLKEIGICCQKTQKWEKAVKNLRNAAVAYKSITDGKVKASNDISFVKKNIGFCYQKQNLHQEAIAILKESLEDYSKVPYSSHRSEEAFINEIHQMISNSNEVLKRNRALRPFHQTRFKHRQKRTLPHHTPKHGKR